MERQLLARVELALAISTAIWIGSCATVGQNGGPAPPGPLRVTELVVVDPQGVERVRIGGDLPDAIRNGKRIPRGNKAAGVLLYDGTGLERGGYVTWEPSGNVGLTLDTRQEQVTLFLAGPESASALLLWHGKDQIEMRSDGDGSRFTAVKAGAVAFQEPAVSLGAEACSAYRNFRSKVSGDQALQECQQRFTEAMCRACLQ